MNIKKQKDTLIISIPLWQDAIDAADQVVGKVPNVIGVCAGNDFTISYAIDMTYAGKGIQEGMPMLHFDTKEELEEVCKKFGIDIWTHELCGFCGDVVYGTFTYSDGKIQCLSCEDKE
jgi:hypothetical protein